MEYTTLGTSGLLVSRLSFGCMTLGTGSGGALARVDATGADRMVGRALDAGINFFDTADIYTAGESERLLGKALGKHLNDVIIATKLGNRGGKGINQTGLAARYVHEAIDASLERLGRDWIDLYIAHRYDAQTPLEETLHAFEMLVRAGKVRYLGFSNWPAWVVAKALEIQRRNSWTPFINGQMYYSLLGRDVEQEIVPCLRDYGIGMTVWSPLASGFLSGRYSREEPTGGGGRLSQIDITPFDREHGFAVLDVVKSIAKARNATPAAVSLAWILARPAVASVILGISTEQQLQANLASVELKLDVSELAALDQVSEVPLLFPHWFIKRTAAYTAPPKGFVPWN